VNCLGLGDRCIDVVVLIGARRMTSYVCFLWPLCTGSLFFGAGACSANSHSNIRGPFWRVGGGCALLLLALQALGVCACPSPTSFLTLLSLSGFLCCCAFWLVGSAGCFSDWLGFVMLIGRGGVGTGVLHAFVSFCVFYIGRSAPGASCSLNWWHGEDILGSLLFCLAVVCWGEGIGRLFRGLFF